MTQIRKMVALGAAAVGLALCPSGYAQDDLDDLLKDLESEAETAAKAPAGGGSQQIDGDVTGRKWAESAPAIDESILPTVSDLHYVGKKVVGKVKGLQPTIRYNIYFGKDIKSVNEIALDKPFMCPADPEAEVEFVLDVAGEGDGYLQVRRQSISGK